RARAEELLAFVKLTGLAGEFAGNLSYGQQKLVEFVRVLMTDPELILLDEPAAGVNRTLLNDLLEAVRTLRDRGKTVLLVEHDMNMSGVCFRRLGLRSGLGYDDRTWPIFVLRLHVLIARVHVRFTRRLGGAASGLAAALLFALYLRSKGA